MRIAKEISALWLKASPQIRKKVIIIFSMLLFLNIAVWMGALFITRMHPVFLGLVTLAYGLGLRHAVDADHIAAIDNTTRKLMTDGKRPITVGLFFSLGHSTVVILLSLLVAVSSSFLSHTLPYFTVAGAIIGTLVSSIFLILIGLINFFVFIEIFKSFQNVIKKQNSPDKIFHTHIAIHGVFAKICKPFLNVITASWQMYFVGFLFGLGFDTASEIALLSISATSGPKGLSLFEILLLPISFTVGMALIDTLDGVLMLGAYGWAYITPIRKLYYNLTITGISVLIALCIGCIEVLQLLASQFKLPGVFFQEVNTCDITKIGYIIILGCILLWLFSIMMYKRKRYEKLR